MDAKINPCAHAWQRSTKAKIFGLICTRFVDIPGGILFLRDICIGRNNGDYRLTLFGRYTSIIWYVDASDPEKSLQNICPPFLIGLILAVRGIVHSSLKNKKAVVTKTEMTKIIQATIPSPIATKFTLYSKQDALRMVSLFLAMVGKRPAYTTYVRYLLGVF